MELETPSPSPSHTAALRSPLSMRSDNAVTTPSSLKSSDPHTPASANVRRLHDAMSRLSLGSPRNKIEVEWDSRSNTPVGGTRGTKSSLTVDGQDAISIAASPPCADLLSPVEKEQYNRFITEAKELQSVNAEASLFLYGRAIGVFYTPKLQTKIDKLQNAVKGLYDGAILQEDGFFLMKGSEERDYRVRGGLVVPAEVYDALYPFQREGVQWMWEVWLKGEGGLLGDDMGLGKTVQTLLFLRCLHESGLLHSALIVLPTAVVQHWERSCERWIPGVDVGLFHGTAIATREKALARIQDEGGICITTYGLVTTSSDRLGGDGSCTWDLVILDEGHRIKNRNTKIAKSIRCVPSARRLVLSGTPIQNNLQELWSLFDYVCEQRLLGPYRTFKVDYEGHILRASHKNASDDEIAKGTMLAQHLWDKIAPYFLRREKKNVFGDQNAQLATPAAHNKQKRAGAQEPDTPPLGGKKNEEGLERKRSALELTAKKDDFVVWLPLSSAQLELYRAFLDKSQHEIRDILNNSKSPLAAISVLKKICDHPRLVQGHKKVQAVLSEDFLSEEVDGDSDAEDVAKVPQGEDKALGSVFDDDAPAQTAPSAATSKEDGIDLEELVAASCKLQFIEALLPVLQRDGHRVLIFSQSLRMLAIVKKIISSCGFQHLGIDGSITNLGERQLRIDKFNQDESIFAFLMTTQVGGVGISLTGADRVIIIDPSWNDLDNQAVDRVYRPGQVRDVIAYRLITCGTIEEKIYRKQIFKQSLTKSVLNNKQYRYFTATELSDLFTLENPDDSQTQRQLHALHGEGFERDAELTQHIDVLKSFGMFGVSDHNLLFTKSEADVEAVLSSFELPHAPTPCLQPVPGCTAPAVDVDLMEHATRELRNVLAVGHFNGHKSQVKAYKRAISAINQCEDPAIQLERVLDCLEIHDGDPMLHLRALALTEIVFPDDV